MKIHPKNFMFEFSDCGVFFIDNINLRERTVDFKLKCWQRAEFLYRKHTYYVSSRRDSVYLEIKYYEKFINI